MSTPPPILMTADELAAHERELARLRGIRDRDLPEIDRLAELVRDVTVVDDATAAVVVCLGSVVTVEPLDGGQTSTYRVVASAAGAGQVSARSPVGGALLGRRVGDEVVVELPAGGTRPLRVRDVAPGASGA